jgi:hypothetical protein
LRLPNLHFCRWHSPCTTPAGLQVTQSPHFEWLLLDDFRYEADGDFHELWFVVSSCRSLNYGPLWGQQYPFTPDVA